VAAASGIDEDFYRLTGEVIIDPSRAVGLGSAYIESQDVDLVEVNVETAPDGSTVSVLVVGELDLGLMGAFVDQGEPLMINARASAVPTLVP
jgi:hypothetical protein